jgi:hypothetical protein
MDRVLAAGELEVVDLHGGNGDLAGSRCIIMAAIGVSGGMAIEERSPGWVRERGGAAARDGSLFLRESFFRVLAMEVRIFCGSEISSRGIGLGLLGPKQNFYAEHAKFLLVPF